MVRHARLSMQCFRDVNEKGLGYEEFRFALTEV